MKDFSRAILHLLFFAFFPIVLPSCASDQQGQEDQEELDQSQDEESAEAQDQQGDDAYGDEEGSDGDLGEISELSQQTTMTEDNGGLNNMGMNMNNMNSMNNLNDLSDGIADLGGDAQLGENTSLGNEDMGAGMMDAGAGAAAPAMGPPPADNSGRVVRFVLSDETPVLDKPDATGSPVGSVYQGDPLVVMVQGDWAEISTGRYIQVAALSEMIVPRSRPETDWTAPAGQDVAVAQ